MTDSLVSSPPGSPLTPEPEDCNLDAFIEDKRWIIPETPPCFAQLPDTLTSDTSQTFSDCTVIYGSGKKIMKLSVHKSVLCVRSGFFKGVFAGDFKVRIPDSRRLGLIQVVSQEGQTNTVTLSEDKEDDIEKMFTFLYSSKYCIGGCDNEICDGCGYINGSFNVHANMYALADKYLIPDLKAYARKKFKKMLKLLDSTAKCAEPFEACHARTLNDLFYALPVLNKNTPDSDRGLRQMANHAISQNIGCIEEVDMLARAMIGNNDLCYVWHLDPSREAPAHH